MGDADKIDDTDMEASGSLLYLHSRRRSPDAGAAISGPWRRRDHGRQTAPALCVVVVDSQPYAISGGFDPRPWTGFRGSPPAHAMASWRETMWFILIVEGGRVPVDHAEGARYSASGTWPHVPCHCMAQRSGTGRHKLPCRAQQRRLRRGRGNRGQRGGWLASCARGR